MRESDYHRAGAFYIHALAQRIQACHALHGLEGREILDCVVESGEVIFVSFKHRHERIGVIVIGRNGSDFGIVQIGPHPFVIR